VSARGDFLVIGSGIAGLRAALSLAAAGTVVILTKADPSESNTDYAQGGISCAVGPDDSTDLHLRDTLAAGDDLCVTEAVRVLVDDGPRYVQELIDWGVTFDREADGSLALGKEAAHSVRRVLHSRDTTGRAIGRTLWQKASAHAHVRVERDAQALALLVQDGRCVGARYVAGDGRTHDVHAGATLIATGGAGQVFRETTNPAVATGDGVAMAFDAGARVADLEFVQFHPTALSVEGAPRFLLSEALRGEGAHLVNASGERFVERYDPDGELAPRDRVARAIVREVLRSQAPVFLSLAHLDAEYIRARFPAITAACRRAGLDLATDRIPVTPAAHYVMGGVETDLHGRTSLPGLFAAGEVACTGVHGANRLASNSLLEGLVFGARAAAAMQLPARESRIFAALDTDPWPEPRGPVIDTSAELRDVMWRHAGLVREHEELGALVARLAASRVALAASATRAPIDPDRRRLANLVTVGLLMARAALRREESRGGHFRADFPRRDDLHWRRHVADVTPADALRA
jgi:L-aspartate oxidase